MTELKQYALQSLPSQSETGAVYYISDGRHYIGKSDGSFLQITNLENVSSLPVIGELDKLYILNDGNDISVHIWNGNTYVNINEITSIHANNVIQSSDKVFVSSSQRGQIDANSTELASHSQRIATLESTTTVSTDEKVKMNAITNASYMEDLIDGATIQNVNNKLVVKGIEGLIATITELNLLTGATSNIQAQINALSSVGNFTTSVDTHAELSTLTPSTNDMVIVIADETLVDSTTSIYIYNGINWIYSGKFGGGQLRDFTTNPLNLNTETTGLLPKTKYEKQNANETPFTDSSGNIIANNTQDAIKELFTYANNIKSIANVIGSPLNTSDTSAQLNAKMQQLKVLFASYLNQKGVIAYPYNTIEEMINKVLSIPNITLEGAIKKISKLNITAPYELRIQLDEALSLNDITTTLIEFVAGATGVVHYDIGFDNGDARDFESNENVVFDGKMRLRDNWELQLQTDDLWIDGILQYIDIDSSDFIEVRGINLE